MLTPLSQRRSQYMHSRQKGVVLLISLIMLVAMTLAAIALMRSVDTANMVAGNLAFQQASYNVADTGTEQAITYMKTTVTVAQLNCDITVAGMCPEGYKSKHEAYLEPPTSGVTWDDYWNSMAASPGVHALSGLPSGYSGAFVIEALCDDIAHLVCSTSSVTTITGTAEGGNQGASNIVISNGTVTTSVPYYRITTRVEGPRNSVGYVQTVIAW